MQKNHKPASACIAGSARHTDFLAGLTDADRAAFLGRCEVRRAPAGTTLFSQGQPHTESFVVARGLIRTYYLSPVGKEITLAFWAAGHLVGGPDFFGSSCHVWSARSVKDTDVYALDGAVLKQLVLSSPGIAESVIDALVFKIHWLSHLFQKFATESVTDRLAHQLVRLCEMHGHPQADGVSIEHEFTQEDLANMVGATRQWVSITLSELQRAGLVRIEKRRLMVLDLEALRNYYTEAGAGVETRAATRR